MPSMVYCHHSPSRFSQYSGAVHWLARTASQPSESHSSAFRSCRFHELEIFAIGDEARRQPEGREISLMPRTFVVERESHIVRADRMHASVEAPPCQWICAPGLVHSIPHSASNRAPGRPNCGPPRIAIGRTQRICPQPMLYIGDEKLLVLLLMVDSEQNQVATSGLVRS